MDSQRFDALTRSLARGTTRRGLLKGVGGGLAAVLGLTRRPAAAGQAKRPLCHATGDPANPWVVIEVAEPAWKAHFAHGDTPYVNCGTAADCPLPTPGTCEGAPTCTDGACGFAPVAATANILCRESDDECHDHAYCDGLSTTCPANPALINGTTCSGGVLRRRRHLPGRSSARRTVRFPRPMHLRYLRRRHLLRHHLRRSLPELRVWYVPGHDR